MVNNESHNKNKIDLENITENEYNTKKKKFSYMPFLIAAGVSSFGRLTGDSNMYLVCAAMPFSLYGAVGGLAWPLFTDKSDIEEYAKRYIYTCWKLIIGAALPYTDMIFK